ncbi:hypothetical protein L249_3606 [Ophiocordyceps polyrhachis-furcata BCC 54312]|uniref:Uncharacterized protein n=1 Tax=Ophiocordyceps polyrhachis-furcata BCC 54312 TaxID=1330021 RepID=A0A367LMF0_9HYPO|nr:hypothetical protein L249_3606 [Ophiocordyceps polyrhachis-furcata BCC 54312]
MKTTPTLHLLFLLLFTTPITARWVFDKRSSCQLCAVGPLNGGDACCSASCAAQHKDIHGGHCNDKK